MTLDSAASLIVIISSAVAFGLAAAKLLADVSWMRKQLKPNGGTSLRDRVDDQGKQLATVKQDMATHTYLINDLAEETKEQSKSLRRIEEGRGQTVATISEKIMAVHASEGNRLTQIQDTVIAAKHEAAETAKVVKETLKKHG